MAKERPWWKKKTNWGLIILGVSRACAFFPPTMIATPILEPIGMILTGYGVAKRVENK